MAKQYEVSLDVDAKLIDGRPMLSDVGGEPVKIGRVIADHIAGSMADRNVIKLYNWASEMAQGRPVKLDSEDFGSLKSFIELLPRCPTLIKAQALEIMNEAKPIE
jgi:hypothetical protein